MIHETAPRILCAAILVRGLIDTPINQGIERCSKVLILRSWTAHASARAARGFKVSQAHYCRTNANRQRGGNFIVRKKGRNLAHHTMTGRHNGTESMD
jgi:hypothetical protein